METRSINVLVRKDGRLHAEVVIWIRETNENFAYEIVGAKGKNPYYIADGARHDLTEHQKRKLRETIKEVGA